MKIRVLLAEREMGTIQAIKSGVDFGQYKMEVVGVVSCESELLEAVRKHKPQMLIADKNIEEEDLLATLKNMKEELPDCRILVISGEENFDFLYEMLRLEIGGYMKKPLDIRELNQRLDKIYKEIIYMTNPQIAYEAAVSMRSLYFWKMMFEHSERSEDREFINRITMCHFQPGWYRVLLFRFDQNENIPNFRNMNFYVDINAIQLQVVMQMRRYINEFCYEMIFDFRFNGVVAIINYDHKYDNNITYTFEDMRARIHEYSGSEYDMALTLCVGGAYDSFAQIDKSREDAYKVAWSRIKKGINKVLYWKEPFAMQESYQKQMEEIIANLKQTCETLSEKDFQENVDALFKLPDFVLSDYTTRTYILSYVNYFFEVNREVLSTHMNVYDEEEMLKKTLNYSCSIKHYEQNFRENMQEMYSVLTVDMDKQNIRPLRKATKYIKENYNRQITVEKIAEAVNLSPVYFSHLFKKQTGKNVTDYIAEYRMEAAKKLLFDTEMSICEIASEVGFQDQRYFSKRFKQMVGMKPSDYRKLK